MSSYDLRQSHETPEAFDGILVGVAVFGAVVAWLSFFYGGWWEILGIAALLGEVLLVYGCFVEPRQIIVLQHREPLVADPKTWIRILFFSDMHAGAIKHAEWYARVVEKAKTLKADIAVLGGDLVVDRTEPVHELEAFTGLTPGLGKFYVMGNHDLVDRPSLTRQAIESWGYSCLENKTMRLTKNGQVFDLSGVADPWFGQPHLIERTKDVPHVLISHEPDILMDLNAGDTDLMIAGHTHGGQVRLPFIGALWPIPCKLGRAVDRGRKVINGVPCIISQGLGESDGRIRLFVPPSIICVDIGI